MNVKIECVMGLMSVSVSASSSESYFSLKGPTKRLFRRTVGNVQLGQLPASRRARYLHIYLMFAASFYCVLSRTGKLGETVRTKERVLLLSQS